MYKLLLIRDLDATGFYKSTGKGTEEYTSVQAPRNVIYPYVV